MKKTVTLFLTFLKIGLFTFGGGYAMIALLKEEFVSKKKWITDDMFLDMVAIAESTPGPVAINSATYIGYRTAGFWGAIASTIAVCTPSFAIIYLISSFFDGFLEFSYVRYALDGIQACVVYLILNAGIQIWRGIRKSPFDVGIFAVVFVFMILFSLFAVDFSTVFYIIICGTIGVAGHFAKSLGHRRDGE